jgi:hypothetical protein
MNSVSKAVLRMVCHTLSQTHNQVHYFPAYEMMIDDLRDYRFYAADMIHPSSVAEAYIWDHFVATFVDQESQEFIQEWKQIRSDLDHRPFHPTSEAHQEFLKKLEQRISVYASNINVESELKYVRNQLINSVE